MKKNLNISNEELLKLDYKHTHLLKKFTGHMVCARRPSIGKGIEH